MWRGRGSILQTKGNGRAGNAGPRTRQRLYRLCVASPGRRSLLKVMRDTPGPIKTAATAIFPGSRPGCAARNCELDSDRTAAFLSLMHLNKLQSFHGKAPLPRWMWPLVSCPSGLHRQMSVTMCPAAHQPRPLLGSRQMSQKEHDRTLIRRWRESPAHCHLLAPVSEKSQQQNLPPVSPSLRVPYRSLHLPSMIAASPEAPPPSHFLPGLPFCYASDQVHAGISATLPGGRQGPQLPRAQDAFQVASIFTVAGPDRSLWVKMSQYLCLEERGLVSRTGRSATH